MKILKNIGLIALLTLLPAEIYAKLDNHKTKNVYKNAKIEGYAKGSAITAATLYGFGAASSHSYKIWKLGLCIPAHLATSGFGAISVINPNVYIAAGVFLGHAIIPLGLGACAGIVWYTSEEILKHLVIKDHDNTNSNKSNITSLKNQSDENNKSDDDKSDSVI